MIKIGDLARLCQISTVTLRHYDEIGLLKPAYDAVYKHLKTQSAKETGVCLTVWHSSPDTYVNEDAEAAVSIDRAVPGSELVQVYELPQTQVASVVHQGDFAEFTKGHAALLDWVGANNYRIVGPYREIYIKLDGDRSDSTTEIQYPVEKN